MALGRRSKTSIDSNQLTAEKSLGDVTRTRRVLNRAAVKLRSEKHQYELVGDAGIEEAVSFPVKRGVITALPSHTPLVCI